MNIQLAIKLLPYIGLGISLILFLGLFYGLSRMIGSLRSRVGILEAQCQQALELNAAVQGLTRRIDERETGTPTNETPIRTAGSLNGTVRSKVLKMHRLGQSPERIADNLRVPQGEVDLLVKVHQIVMRPYEQVPSGSGEAEAS
jgi:hypothetical protein